MIGVRSQSMRGERKRGQLRGLARRVALILSSLPRTSRHPDPSPSRRLSASPCPRPCPRNDLLPLGLILTLGLVRRTGRGPWTDLRIGPAGRPCPAGRFEAAPCPSAAPDLDRPWPPAPPCFPWPFTCWAALGSLVFPEPWALPEDRLASAGLRRRLLPRSAPLRPARRCP